MKLDLDHYVPGLLLWLSNKISGSASQLYLSRFDVGVTDWRVLAYFVVYPWSTASKASELMGLDKGAVSRSISFLTHNGFLVSRPDGRRRIEHCPTSKGRKLHDNIYRFAIEREAALLTGFSSNERATLVKMLHRLLDNLPLLDAVGREGS